MTRRVCLLLAHGFEEYEAAVFTDVLGWSRSDGLEGVEVVTAARRDSLVCTWNFRVAPEARLDEIDPGAFDALAVPGGFEEAGFYEDAYHDEFSRFIRAFDERQKILAGVCVGALALGQAGVLRGKKATTYHLLGGKRRAQLAAHGADVQDAPFVVDGRVITCAGPAGALAVAFETLRQLTSLENLKAVKTAMGFTP